MTAMSINHFKNNASIAHVSSYADVIGDYLSAVRRAIKRRKEANEICHTLSIMTDIINTASDLVDKTFLAKDGVSYPVEFELLLITFEQMTLKNFKRTLDALDKAEFPLEVRDKKAQIRNMLVDNRDALLNLLEKLKQFNKLDDWDLLLCAKKSKGDLHQYLAAHSIEVSAESWEFIMKAMEDHSAPNDYLRHAASAYRANAIH